MEVTIAKNETTFTKVDVKFPIYSLIEDDEARIYTKLTEKEFYQIRIGHDDITINRFKTNGKTINSIWYENQCNKTDFDNVVKHVKNTLKDF